MLHNPNQIDQKCSSFKSEPIPARKQVDANIFMMQHVPERASPALGTVPRVAVTKELYTFLKCMNHA